LEATADLTKGRSFATDPVEDLAHQARLFEHDVEAGHATAGSFADVTVPERCRRQGVDAPLACRVELATAVALQELGSLVLGNHALNLEEQPVLRVAAEWAVEKNDFQTAPLKFINKQSLICISSLQSIRRVDVETVHTTGRRLIAQFLHRGSDQRRAGVTVIDEAKSVLQAKPVLTHPRARRASIWLPIVPASACRSLETRA
jgi:hypothetical protein